LFGWCFPPFLFRKRLPEFWKLPYIPWFQCWCRVEWYGHHHKTCSEPRSTKKSAAGTKCTHRAFTSFDSLD
jgi:hypothetical protein